MTILGDQIVAKARSYIGQFEDGPDVPKLAQAVATKFPDLASYCSQARETTAWCGIFVAFVLSEFGIRPPATVNGVGFMWVDRWKDWGTPVPYGEAQEGDVAIYLGNPHHVNFIPGVGGNQGDEVNEHSYRAPDYVRRAIQPGTYAHIPATKRNTRIIATVFSSEEGNKTTAYADVGPGWDQRPGVALPWRFKSPRPHVRVINPANGKSVVCDIIDQGPWNYTGTKTPGDPYWQTGARPQAESGTDQSGRHTNGAGIDLTPAAASAIGINGKGLVDWEFTESNMADDTTPKPPATQDQAHDNDFFLRVFQYFMQNPEAFNRIAAFMTFMRTGAMPNAPAATTPAAPEKSKLDLGGGILGIIGTILAAKNGSIAPLFESMTSTILPALFGGLATWGAGGGTSIIGTILKSLTKK